jgi:hypothetical protein
MSNSFYADFINMFQFTGMGRMHRIKYFSIHRDGQDEF